MIPPAKTPTSDRIDYLRRIVQFVERDVLARGFDCLSLKVTRYLLQSVWSKLRCLRYHHRGDLDLFVATVGPTMPSKLFACTGRQPHCSCWDRSASDASPLVEHDLGRGRHDPESEPE
jgi:hypothetical protein